MDPAAFAADRPCSTSDPGFSTRFLQVAFWLVATGVGLIALGAQWQLIASFGTDLPMMDQWDAEAQRSLRPWLEGRFSLSDLLWQPHNEHRPGLTRAWALLTILWNGQWDPAFGATLAVLVRVAVSLSLLVLFRPVLVGPGWWTLPPVVAAVLAAPLAWENTLNPFQIQFCLLTATALVQLAWFPVHPVRSVRWWLAVLAGAGGLLTMGSSFLAPAAAVAVRGWMAWQRREWTRDDSITVAVGVLLACVGLLGLPGAPTHGALHAPGVARFFAALVRILAYPWHDLWGFVLILQAPLAWWVLGRVRRRAPLARPLEALLLGLALWLTLQITALAYARGGAGWGMASRYAELYALLPVLQGAALGALWASGGSAERARLKYGAWIWILVLGAGLAREARRQAETYLVPMPAQWQAYTRPLHDYVGDGDATRLEAVPGEQLVHPSREMLREVLDDPEVRRYLPASLRPPAPFTVDAPASFTRGAALPSPVPTRADAGDAAWFSAGAEPATWRSEPLPTGSLLPVLRLTFAGDPRLPPTALRLEGDDGRTVPLEIRQFAGDKWQTAHLFVPRGAENVRLVAEAGPEGAWLAFTAPVELGLGTWLAHQARKSGVDLIWSGAVLLALGLAFGEPRPPPARATRTRLSASQSG